MVRDDCEGSIGKLRGWRWLCEGCTGKLLAVLNEQFLQRFIQLHVFRNVGIKEGVAVCISKRRI